MSDYDEQWRCDWCKRIYPVPSLARDCEDRHLVEDSRKSLKSSA